ARPRPDAYPRAPASTYRCVSHAPRPSQTAADQPVGAVKHLLARSLRLEPSLRRLSETAAEHRVARTFHPVAVATAAASAWAGRRLSHSALLLSFDLFESGSRALELVVEQPHRIQDFAEGRGGFRPVRLAEGEHGV